MCADVPALDAKMEDAAVFVFHGGVLPPESATVVRQSGGDFLITDGPYTETKEHHPNKNYRVRCPRSRPRCSMSAPVASDTRSPFNASRESAHAQGLS